MLYIKRLKQAVVLAALEHSILELRGVLWIFMILAFS
jgi:hypothetical protein